MEVNDIEDLAELIRELRHHADKLGISYAGADALGTKRYFRDIDPEGETFGASYTGWDRIHDDNRAEFRPIGDDWSAAGVSYQNGHKVYAPKKSQDHE